MICPKEVFANLFPIPERGGLEALFTLWKVNGDLPYFNGHFPQSPILPAVAIVDISTYVLQRSLRQPDLKLRSVLMAKFLSPIEPGQEIRLEWEAVRGSEWLIKWKDATTGKLLANLSVDLGS